MVEVIRFPKKCPHCKQPMQLWRAMLECVNYHCLFVARQTKEMRTVAGVLYPATPYRFGGS